MSKEPQSDLETEQLRQRNRELAILNSIVEAQQVLRWLMKVRWIALADLVLLIVLLVASFANNEKMVEIFGLTHGIVFLALIAIVGIGAVRKLWSWWFLVGTLITTGPPGALLGKS